MDARGGVPTAADLPSGERPGARLASRRRKRVLFRSRRTFPVSAEQVYLVSLNGGMPRAAAGRPGRARRPVAGRPVDRLQPDLARGPHLEALPGRHGAGHLDRPARRWRLPARDHLAGNRQLPMWQGDAIYFTSDREYGTLNLYRYDVETGRDHGADQLPRLRRQVPLRSGPERSSSSTGETLRLLDLATGEVRQVDRCPPRVRPGSGVAGRLDGTGPRRVLPGLSPDGETAAARGARRDRVDPGGRGRRPRT